MKTILSAIILFLFNQVYTQTINVPIDYRNHELGSFELEYEFGKKFNPNLPTVIVIADAQQFYVRKGGITKIQNSLFGDKINVLGIIPRGNNNDLKLKIDMSPNDSINWELAYNIFNSYQFSNDIERVIETVLDDKNDIYLYGQSGGAFLITEYLSLFPSSKVDKVFIGANVNPIIESKLGINHDNFNSEFLSKNTDSKEKLENVLNDGFFTRNLISSLFQRQNFFVEIDSLNQSRTTLINELYQKDTLSINQKRKIYQIDAINNFLASESGVPIRIRLFEFIKPLIKNLDKLNFYPDLENSYNIAQPLIENKRINESHYQENFNEKTIRNYKGEIFVLAGRYDHVADYRSSIYLSALMENCHLFIADDDHTFKQLKSEKKYSKLIQDFFFLDNKTNWILSYEDNRWVEK